MTVNEQNKYISDVVNLVDKVAETRKQIEEENKNRKPVSITVYLHILALVITTIIDNLDFLSYNIRYAFTIACLVLVLLGVIRILLALIKKKKQKALDDQRFKNGEMSQTEREAYIKRKIKFAEQAYNHGDITLIQLEALKKIIQMSLFILIISELHTLKL